MAEQNLIGIYEKLSEVQANLKAPKINKNDFGNYKYRSAEDILELVKPLLKEQDLVLVVSDEMVNLGDRYYVKATASVKSMTYEGSVEATAYAREAFSKKGMDEAQITGSASSYARKYALSGLFNIDDNKDPDTMDNSKHEAKMDMSPTEKSVDRAKVWINHELENLGYDTPVAKQAFLQTVLGKTVISSQKDADEVTEALRVERESKDE